MIPAKDILFGDNLRMVSDPSSLRILMLSTSLPMNLDDYRGSFVLEMARALTARGHRISIITPSPGLKTPAVEDIDGIHIRRVPILNPGNKSTLFGKFGVLESLAKHPWLAWQVLPAALGMAVGSAGAAAKHDLIISHWMLPSGLIAAGLRRMGGPPHLLIEHGGGLRILKAIPAPLAKKVLVWIAGGTERIQCVSSAMTEEIRELDPAAASLCYTLPAGVELPDSFANRKVPKLPLKVLFVGRMVEQKGPQILMQALGNLDDVQCTFVGDGPLLAKLKSDAEKLNLGGRCVFPGELPPSKLGPMMIAHHVLVVPSLPMPNGQEGTPTILLKGMAHGLVPVASRTGGIPDLVNHGVNGLLVHPGDHKSLAKTLGGLIDRPAQIPELSDKAMETGRSFSWKVVLDRMERVFLDILNVP